MTCPCQGAELMLRAGIPCFEGMVRPLQGACWVLERDTSYLVQAKIENKSITIEKKRHQSKLNKSTCTVLPAKSDSEVMFCLQSYQGFRIGRSLVY